MSESEFDIIHHYFTDLSPAVTDVRSVVLGIGDDAAIVQPAQDQQLLIAIDTLNCGVHFSEQCSPADIGYKALAVNLSDIAAMGGEPLWFTLALSLPESDPQWLAEFCSGMRELLQQYPVSLIGGDTTRGPLSITIQIAGQVPATAALRRDQLSIGDDLYITGNPGEAAAGLALSDTVIVNEQQRQLLQRLHRPEPRVALGQALRGIAHACIDVSDGLSADLSHMLNASAEHQAQPTGACLFAESLPVSAALQDTVSSITQQREYILHGGDDYELCFSAAPEQKQVIEALAMQYGLAITCIGQVIAEPGLFLQENQQRQPITPAGFDHFRYYP